MGSADKVTNQKPFIIGSWCTSLYPQPASLLGTAQTAILVPPTKQHQERTQPRLQFLITVIPKAPRRHLFRHFSSAFFANYYSLPLILPVYQYNSRPSTSSRPLTPPNKRLPSAKEHGECHEEMGRLQLVNKSRRLPRVTLHIHLEGRENTISPLGMLANTIAIAPETQTKVAALTSDDRHFSMIR